VHVKLLSAVYVKHTSFSPSTDVKRIPIDQVHIMQWQCMFTLHMCILPSLWI